MKLAFWFVLASLFFAKKLLGKSDKMKTAFCGDSRCVFHGVWFALLSGLKIAETGEVCRLWAVERKCLFLENSETQMSDCCCYLLVDVLGHRKY